MNKRVISIILTVIFGFFIVAVNGRAHSRESVFVRKVTVVIDAGHGGIDNGAKGRVHGALEAEINLAVAKKLKVKFEEISVNAVMTRNSALGLYGLPTPGFKLRDLKKRVEITKNAGADIFISIHTNNFPDSSQRGARVFFRDDEPSKELAVLILRELDKIDEDNKSQSASYGDYYVLNNQSVPSVLCEIGFLSNEQDEKLLLDDAYQGLIADAVFAGALQFLYNKN
ncbi:MAG: N-acetylmuramoyl-L-alanine amidase [Christensenellaceae bacterium]